MHGSAMRTSGASWPVRSIARRARAGSLPPERAPALGFGSMELLAPAGGLEAGLAALQYGADAVYLGLKRFSARADAQNFTLDELDRFLGHARALTPARRVFVAVNTLVLD